MKKYEMSKKVFNGRQDVYATGYIKPEGGIGFCPARKSSGEFKKLKNSILEQHFSGEQLIGIYPLISDNTVNFIAADFDDHGENKKKKGKPLSDSKAYRKAARKLGVHAYIERSRSGKGYHVWIFFKDPLPASKARKLADKILSMAGISEKEDSSFCRFFPAQDSVPEGKLGNLIALPFWGKAMKKGNSVFLNPKNDWEPYKKRSEFYKQIKFVKKKTVDAVIEDNELTDISEKNCESKKDSQVIAEDNWVIELINGVDKGKRNDSATRLAGHYLAKKLPFEEVKIILSSWNEKNSPPLDLTELYRIIESIYSRESEKQVQREKFFQDNRFNPMSLVKYIEQTNDLIHDGSGFFRYGKEGVWVQKNDHAIGKKIIEILGSKTEKHYVSNVMKLLEMQVYKDFTQIEHNPQLLNVKNGMLDLSTMELSPHDKKHLSKNQLPIVYDPEAKCPRWDQFLAEVFSDDPQKIKTVRDFAGYCLFSKIHIHKCLMLTGMGGNGKSILVNIYSKLMGPENVASLEPHNLTDKFLIGTLKDKLLNVSTEIQGNKIENSVWRQVIAGDVVQADRKFGQPFSFRPIAKHIFSMNKTPIITDRTNAFSRRIIVVRFNVTFDDNTADKNLEDELTSELSGIFNWALKGFKKVLKTDNIFESQQIRDDKKDFLKAADPILNFLEERCIIGDDHSVRKADLYNAFSDWCRNSELKRMSRKDFYNQLLIGNKKIKKGRPKGSIRSFLGVDLK